MEEKIVFVLTETVSTDPTDCYNEVFGRREDAVRRMKQRYKEDAIDTKTLIMESDINEEEGTANARTADDIIIAWNIKECVIFE